MRVRYTIDALFHITAIHTYEDEVAFLASTTALSSALARIHNEEVSAMPCCEHAIRQLP